MLDLLIDKNHFLSIRKQIAIQIAVLVHYRFLPPGEKLPSETGLARHLDISRDSIREAYRFLEDKNFIRSDGRRVRTVAEHPDWHRAADYLGLEFSPDDVGQKIKIVVTSRSATNTEFVKRELPKQMRRIINGCLKNHRAAEDRNF